MACKLLKWKPDLLGSVSNENIYDSIFIGSVMSVTFAIYDTMAEIQDGWP